MWTNESQYDVSQKGISLADGKPDRSGTENCIHRPVGLSEAEDLRRVRLVWFLCRDEFMRSSSTSVSQQHKVRRKQMSLMRHLRRQGKRQGETKVEVSY